MNMECSYFKKANLFRRLIGIKGYCTFHKTYIKEYMQISYHPYVCCKGMKGEVLENCSPQLRMMARDK